MDDFPLIIADPETLFSMVVAAVNPNSVWPSLAGPYSITNIEDFMFDLSSIKNWVGQELDAFA